MLISRVVALLPIVYAVVYAAPVSGTSGKELAARHFSIEESFSPSSKPDTDYVYDRPPQEKREAAGKEDLDYTSEPGVDYVYDRPSQDKREAVEKDDLDLTPELSAPYVYVRPAQEKR